MNYFLLFVSASLGALTSLISRFVKKDSDDVALSSTSNAATFLIAFLTIFLFGQFSIGGDFFSSISRVPFHLAALYGVAMATAQFSFLLAVGRGSVSVSTLFYSCGFILPTFWGAIRFHESIRFLALLGVALVVASFALSTKKSDKKEKSDARWFVFAIVAAVCSGVVGIAQKEFAAVATCSSDVFLFVAFAISAVFSFLLSLTLSARRKGARKRAEKGDFKRALLGALPLGAVMGCANKLNTYLAGKFESVVTFPCVNGGRILLTAVLSAWIFKEKQTLRQKIAVGVGFLGIIFISI